MLCIIIFISIVHKNESLKYRYFSQWNEKNITSNIYFTHYKTAILVFKKYPFFGSGIKNFRVEVKKIIDDEFKDDKNYNNWQVITTHPHQINFEIWKQVFLVTCFIIFLITYFCFQKILRKNQIFLIVSTIFCLTYINFSYHRAVFLHLRSNNFLDKLWCYDFLLGLQEKINKSS